MFIAVKIMVVMLLLPTCKRFFFFPKLFKSNGHFWLSHQNMAPELHSILPLLWCFPASRASFEVQDLPGIVGLHFRLQRCCQRNRFYLWWWQRGMASAPAAAWYRLLLLLPPQCWWGCHTCHWHRITEACTDNLQISADISPAFLLHSPLSGILSRLLKTWFTAGSS